VKLSEKSTFDGIASGTLALLDIKPAHCDITAPVLLNHRPPGKDGNVTEIGTSSTRAKMRRQTPAAMCQTCRQLVVKAWAGRLSI